MPLDEQAALTLAGGDVRDLAEAQDVEAVTAEHVQKAEQAALEAEHKADQSERAALTGQLNPVQAAADREASRYANLRLAVTRRRVQRHQQAERLRHLAAVGADAAKHAGALKDLRDATLADLAIIEDLRRQIAERAEKWNATLGDLIAQGAALEPDPLRPNLQASPSSAHVYAAQHPPILVTKNNVLTPIKDHPDGPVAAIEAAHQVTRQHDPSLRLIRGENGVVVPLGRDPGGHPQRKIDRGELHELSLAEKRDYFDGGAA